MSHEICQTERLRVRAYTIADEAALFEVFADPYARKFYPEIGGPRKRAGMGRVEYPEL